MAEKERMGSMFDQMYSDTKFGEIFQKGMTSHLPAKVKFTCEFFVDVLKKCIRNVRLLRLSFRRKNN